MRENAFSSPDALVFNPSSSYQRPFGPNAPWNIPVASLPRHPQSDFYRDRFWYGSPRYAGHFLLTFSQYTYPVYEVSEATGSYPVLTTYTTNLHNKTIPWHPDWRPASGTDAQAIILDPANGFEWDLWQVSFDGIQIIATNGNLVQEGVRQGDGSRPGNYWKKENGYHPSRGCGIPYLAMLVRPEEIAAGEIRHALSMPVINTDGDFFVPPATKLEHPGRGPGIPEGMRFALRITDAEIESWIAGLPPALPENTRISARVIARALRDYGWFITDTSDDAHLQFEDRLTAGTKWDDLGLGVRAINYKEYPRRLLDGLLTRERIYTIIPSDLYFTPVQVENWTGY